MKKLNKFIAKMIMAGTITAMALSCGGDSNPSNSSSNSNSDNKLINCYPAGTNCSDGSRFLFCEKLNGDKTATCESGCDFGNAGYECSF